MPTANGRGCSTRPHATSASFTSRALIRSLDPRPGQRFGATEARYVIPDVIVRKQRDRWVAIINPASLPRLRLNRGYADAVGGRNGSNQSLARHLQEARWLLRSIEQRFATIQRVADAIVARQRGFFEYGEVAMKPLTLKLIAGELGLHESTVCRVTNSKYMATPRGLFEFKHFFSRRLATENGGAASATAVRAVMKELIAAEDPRAPLSDAELARLLAQQGLRVARRTITKYRALCACPASTCAELIREEEPDGTHHLRNLRSIGRRRRGARRVEARGLPEERGRRVLRFAPGQHAMTPVGGDSPHASEGSRAGIGAGLGAAIGALVGGGPAGSPRAPGTSAWC